MNPTLSMAQGATDIPLIEQTLGDFFDDMAARQGGLRQVELPMSRMDIGDYLGLTIETV